MILTGTTALTRQTAVVMDQKGVLYPASDIGDLLRSADSPTSATKCRSCRTARRLNPMG